MEHDLPVYFKRMLLDFNFNPKCRKQDLSPAKHTSGNGRRGLECSTVKVNFITENLHCFFVCLREKKLQRDHCN